MKVAYIAPEIPGLSSTFVYNEIFEIGELGFDVVSFSIHPPLENPPNERLKALKAVVSPVYGRGIRRLFVDAIWVVCRKPSACFSTLKMAIGDALANIRKPKLFAGILYRFFVSVSVARELQIRNIAHVHAHFAHFPADIAMYAASIAGVTFSVTAHANDIFCNHWLLPQKVSRSAFFATISDFNREFLAMQGAVRQKLTVIRCGIALDTVNADLPAVRGDGIIRLGFLGRLVEKKGLDVLLQACKVLKQNGLPFSLEVVGNGPLMAISQQHACDMDLNAQVRFIGERSNDDVRDWLNDIDIFVLPCKQDISGDMDGIPVALMEAMLHGKPVITTRLSGIPELVVDNVTGLLASPGDPNDLAAVIQRLYQSEDLAPRLIRNARQHLALHFNRQDNAAKLADLFRNAAVQA